MFDNDKSTYRAQSFLQCIVIIYCILRLPEDMKLKSIKDNFFQLIIWHQIYKNTPRTNCMKRKSLRMKMNFHLRYEARNRNIIYLIYRLLKFLGISTKDCQYPTGSCRYINVIRANKAKIKCLAIRNKQSEE